MNSKRRLGQIRKGDDKDDDRNGYGCLEGRIVCGS